MNQPLCEQNPFYDFPKYSFATPSTDLQIQFAIVFTKYSELLLHAAQSDNCARCPRAWMTRAQKKNEKKKKQHTEDTLKNRFTAK